jgi:hypothetical protein
VPSVFQTVSSQALCAYSAWLPLPPKLRRPLRRKPPVSRTSQRFCTGWSIRPPNRIFLTAPFNSAPTPATAKPLPTISTL